MVVVDTTGRGACACYLKIESVQMRFLFQLVFKAFRERTPFHSEFSMPSIKLEKIKVIRSEMHELFSPVFWNS